MKEALKHVPKVKNSITVSIGVVVLWVSLQVSEKADAVLLPVLWVDLLEYSLELLFGHGLYDTGAPSRVRTNDLDFTKVLLYQLSYRGVVLVGLSVSIPLASVVSTVPSISTLVGW